MLLIRLGLGFALRARRDTVWRAVAVAVSTAGCAAALYVAAVLPHLVAQQQDRSSDRTHEISTQPNQDDVLLRRTGLPWHDEIITIAWVEPVNVRSSPAPPPGMSTFPQPGSSGVSPAVADLIATDASLGRHFPGRTVLTDDGIASADELIAYVHPDRTLGSPKDALRMNEAGDILGARDDGLVRVATLRADDGVQTFFGPEVSSISMAGAVGFFLVVPALILLVVGYRSASVARDQRFAMLAAIGASARSRSAIATVETMTVAGPTVVVVDLLAWMLGRDIEHVPFTSYGVVAGDLSLPWTAQVSVVLGTLLFCGVVAAAAERRPQALSRPAPRLAAEQVRRRALTPVVLAAAIAVLTAFTDPEWDLPLRVLVLLLTVIGAPLIVPFVTQTGGEVIASLRRLEWSLAGRSLAWSPVTASRPVVALAALCVITLGTLGYFAVIEDSDSRPSSPLGGVAAAELRWPAPQEGDVAELRRELPEGLVVRHRDAPGSSATVTLAASCAQLTRVIGLPRCGADDVVRPRSAEATGMLQALSLALEKKVTKVRLEADEPVDDGVGTVLVLARDEVLDLDARVRQAAARLPAADVRSGAQAMRPAPQPVYTWLHAGIQTSFVLLLLGCAMAMVDRGLEAKDRSRLLVDLGASRRMLNTVTALRFLVAYVAACVVGVGTGVALAWYVLDSAASFPWGGLATVSGALAIWGVGGLAVAFALGRQERHIVRD